MSQATSRVFASLFRAPKSAAITIAEPSHHRASPATALSGRPLLRNSSRDEYVRSFETVTNAALCVMLDAEAAPCALLMLLTSARHVIAHDVTEANVPEPLNKN